NTYSVAESTVNAECGIRFSSLCSRLAALGLGGFEELFSIPGSLGGMLYSNAGAYGKEISNLFIEGEFYDTQSGKVIEICRSDMDFSYRSSAMKKRALIALSALLRLEKSSPEAINKRIDYYKGLRLASQPCGEYSLGSVFKRPQGYYAAELIDKAGLKGYRIGGAQVSIKHAGFIVNSNGASAEDFIKLKDYVKNKVFERYGVLLEEEIEILT
ncbi:MAG: UDP-N-acetylmuramate dehydrogenase, partial [Clostridia bacterium]|nr:UDP-N-acetylmuramate dehydrogenase [Clostridia bacterium]